MRLGLKIFAVLVIGVALGLGATWFAVTRMSLGMVSNGPWKMSLYTGSSQSGPYLRANVALHGLFALNRSETIYYTADHDSAGERLDGNCTYRIEGREPSARWWSITAYGPDNYLMETKTKRWSISGETVQLKYDSTFAITAARKKAPSNWIPIKRGRFSLTLRLYNPGPGVVNDPANAMVPTIRRVYCV
ncbi:MAG TPA: DUF1214 domain-containing protein [Rhizomicrobium sp.]|nr:DUF1214 domain-containing protein [Rhizomicrobium sp.]